LSSFSFQKPSYQAETTFLRATVTNITYRNSDSGFGVIKAKSDRSQLPSEHQGNIVTVIGVFPASLCAGTPFIARGIWQTHQKFGLQFKAFSFTEHEPTTIDEIAKYLGSGAIKGFGPKLAQRLVDEFGTETLQVLNETPSRLLDISGIGSKKLKEIIASWTEKKASKEVIMFFQSHGLSDSLAQRIFNTYRERSIEIVKENPYILARDMWGIGFQTADQIALCVGIEPDSSKRIIAGISFALKKAADDGNCYLPRDALLTACESLLKLPDYALLQNGLDTAILAGDVIEEDANYYLPVLHNAEEQLAHIIAKRIKNINKTNVHISSELIDKASMQSVLVQNDKRQVITLSPEQKDALTLAATKNTLIITGGPGCGKTTVLRAIASMFRQAGLRLALAAPTGRASQRLSEVCDFSASTIHRLLKFDPIDRGFVHNQNFPLPVDAVIIDESSMIDLQLANSLFKAIPHDTRVIVVGDADQLPSVGPGLFLSDLLALGDMPRVKLTTLFRRKGESDITFLAHQLNQGIIPTIPEPDGQTKSDAYFIAARESAQVKDLVERLVCDQIPKRFGLKGSDILVLTPMNQGEIGVNTLNEVLQARLIPENSGLPSIRTGYCTIRLGDRVIQRVNNYQICPGGVFNGDQGDVVGIDSSERLVVVKFWDGREVSYKGEAVGELSLAYALTIHRSQGSESPAVVLVLHQSHNIMLERQLVYTGITRAKQLLIIVGTKKALAIATKRSRSKLRYTTLSNKIESLLEL
jgi:exodeoxyribonuclease V alpha subunit